MLFWTLIIRKLRLFCRKWSKNGYWAVYENNSISDRRSVENISGKRLRIEVQPAQTNGVERVKRFVNAHLHCIVSNLEKNKQNLDVVPPWKNFCGLP